MMLQIDTKGKEMTHSYFVAKARARLAAAGGDPDNAGPLAEWAESAKSIGDARRGVIVADNGELIAETLYHRGGPGRPNASYVVEADAKRWGLHADETELATGELQRITGRRLVHVTMSEVCRGAGKHVPEANSGAPDPLARVKQAATEREVAEASLRVAIADSYTAGATPTDLARAAGVTRQTIYRWLAAEGFKVGE